MTDWMNKTRKEVHVNGRSYAWPVRPLVVICIDGSEPDYIEEAVEAGFMPFTKNLLFSGANLRAHSVIPSFTNPNNLSIVTGQPPVIHGICGNFFYDKDTQSEVMMNDPCLLRAPTIFSAFERDGARIAVITAKEKLRRLLGHGLNFGMGGSICFSGEKADEVNLQDNGIEDILNLTGMSLPSIYSGKLSELVLAAGVILMKSERPEIMYLSTTDYIQHKFAPGTQEANDFYNMMDGYWNKLDKLGVTLILTADHGMSAKHDENGAPDVIYLQDLLDNFVGRNQTRVILPITDPYVAHHGALGSYATIYLQESIDPLLIKTKIASVPGIEMILTRHEACVKFELPGDRVGDLVIVSERQKTLGKSEGSHDFSELDVPLRSHGGLTEQIVPLISNTPVSGIPSSRRIRNFDAFDIGLNHVTRI